MSHPNNRAERRLARSHTIRSATKKASFLHWYSRHCTCWPTGSWLRQGCDLHGEKDSKNDRRIGRWAKTGPYNWIFHMEHDYYASGLLRQAYRSGGGRRCGTDDWGGGMHDAGRFDLEKTMIEWGLFDNYVPENYASVAQLDRAPGFEPGKVRVQILSGALALDPKQELIGKIVNSWNHKIGPIAQPGRARLWHSRGRRFKSS